MIRLFKSGTHKNLNFSDDDVSNIAKSTTGGEIEKIPIVLGHPKNDLPVVGYLPKSAIKIYDESGDTALGFDRKDAELSEESMNILRKQGNNKISVRLKDGKITHIGLVKNAAVSENNDQDFSDNEAIFHTDADFEQRTNIIDKIKNSFKMATEKEEKTTHTQDFATLGSKIESIEKTLVKVVDALTATQQTQTKEKFKADFSAEEFTHLTDEQRKNAIDFASTLESSEAVESFKAIVRAGNVKPNVVQGSVATADFSSELKPETTHNIISQQIKELK